MIIRLKCDGMLTTEKVVFSINEKRPIGTMVGMMLKKLKLNSIEGMGMWVCCSEIDDLSLPIIPVERSDTAKKLGLKQGDVLYFKTESNKERRITINECENARNVKAEDPQAYRVWLKCAKQVELSRQQAARKITAMKLIGSEWTQLDPEKLSDDATCTICLHSLASHPFSPIELSLCAHRYHEGCLFSWIGKGTGLASRQCPICRSQINAAQSDSDSSSDDLPPPRIRADRQV
eukprot:TRINITY_DN25187_c0_g1_i1.p1 TRINITY_DN25187_c0_g1~~TRINITY_DN25187_c0_g1_i1.p1  ORF type:complete len:234 (+),score=30.79 TRINITY_DN25187_c0_g1_i1:76-777(+)